MKTIYFAFKEPVKTANLAKFNKWSNQFRFLDLAKEAGRLTPQEEAMLELISANRQGYQKRVMWRLDAHDEFSIASEVVENPQANTAYYARPMLHPDTSFVAENYIKRKSLGLTLFTVEEKSELTFLSDLERFNEEMTSEQVARLAVLKGQIGLSTEENELIQTLEAKKVLCQNWVLMPFYKEVWEQIPVAFRVTLQNELGTIDEIIEDL